MTHIDELRGSTQMWRCRCGYVNVGRARCDMCGAGAATSVDATPIARPLDPTHDDARSEAIRATAAPPVSASEPLSAPPAVLLVVVMIVVGNLAYQQGVVSLVDGRSRDVALLVAMLSGLLFYLATWFVATTAARRVRVKPALGSPRAQAVLAGLAVGGLGGLAALAVAFSSTGHAALDPTAALLVDDGRWGAIIVGAALVVVAAPLVEEYVFRGLLAQSFATHSRGTALWLSSIAFAIAHLSRVRFLYFLMMGLILGSLYLRRGLLASITAHLVFNGAVLATAAIVLTTGGTTTVDAAGLRVTLPAGWHAVSGAGGDDLAAVGPGGAVLEVAHKTLPRGAAVDADAVAQRLALAGTIEGTTVEGARTRALATGLGVEAVITSASESGYVELVPVDRVLYVLTVHAPGHVDLRGPFDAIVRSARPA